MLRNTVFALMAMLAAATSSQAAVMLNVSPGTDIGQGLTQFTLSAVSTGETINSFAQPVVVANAGGAGLHQVALAVTNGLTPTRGDHTPPLWSDTWLPFDSYFFSSPANALALGTLSETNSLSGGAVLLSAGFGAPGTGFGTYGGGGSRVFTAASGIPGTNVPFAQFVVKTNESVLLDIGILDNQGNRTDFQGFQVGGPTGPVNTPPNVNDVTFTDYNNNEPDAPQTLVHQFSATDAEDGAGPFAWDLLTLLSYTPNYGGEGPPPATGPLFPATLSATGEFSWVSEGSPRGDYVWQVRATDSGGLTDLGTLTVNATQVPEPSTLALIGLAMVGAMGYVRRRNS